MKKTYFLIVLLAGINFALFAQKQKNVVIKDTTTSIMTVGEEPSKEKHKDHECISGGPGAIACTVEGGIEFEGGVNGGCGVTCGEKTYACCGLGCRCIRY